MHYVNGSDRNQLNMLTLEDQIGSRHYVRLIDLLSERFVLEHADLFVQKGQLELGRKSYNPAVLMKILFYGYFNGITSSRKLEKECHRNVEMMWLTQKLCPDHKTISDFRKDHSASIKEVIVTFNRLLKDSDYIKGDTVSVDGTKIKANASMSIAIGDIKKKLENVEKQVEDYLEHMEREENKEELEQQVEQLKKEIEELRDSKDTLEQCSAGKLSITDPDARIMKTRQGKFFAYNVQMTVDAEHHLIVNSQVSNEPNDLGQLEPMAHKVMQELGKKPKKLLADKGYFVREQVYALEQQDIECFVPQPLTSQQNKNKEANINFIYNQDKDCFTCSEGRELKFKNYKKDKNRYVNANVYQSDDCDGCGKRSECTTSKTGRKILVYDDQKWRDEYAQKMNSDIGKKKMKQRKTLSEHPFGTIKYLMGQIPLLLRGKTKVATEINLYVLGYNFKRLINIASFETIQQMINGYKWEKADALNLIPITI